MVPLLTGIALVLMSAAGAFAQQAQSANEADAAVEIRSMSMVVDLAHQPGQSVEWIVGVNDDGTKRYGLASSICETLKQHEAADADTIVRIVDFSAFMAAGGNSRQSSLGSVACANYERLDP